MQKKKITTVQAFQSIPPSIMRNHPTEKISPNTKDQWLRMGNERPFPKIIEDREAYIVMFDGPNDPWHPMNWSFSKK